MTSSPLVFGCMFQVESGIPCRVHIILAVIDGYLDEGYEGISSEKEVSPAVHTFPPKQDVDVYRQQVL